MSNNLLMRKMAEDNLNAFNSVMHSLATLNEEELEVFMIIASEGLSPEEADSTRESLYRVINTYKDIGKKD